MRPAPMDAEEIADAWDAVQRQTKRAGYSMDAAERLKRELWRARAEVESLRMFFWNVRDLVDDERKEQGG